MLAVTIIATINISNEREFPGGPEVRTPALPLQGAPGLIPGRENKIPQAEGDRQKKKKNY